MNNNHLSPDLLVDYLHGELAPEDDALAHAHLATCAECRRAVDFEASLTDILRKTAKAQEQELPSLVKAAVWEQIRSAKPGPLARLGAWFRPAIAIPTLGVPALAAVLVAGWFVSPYSHGTADGRTIDASYYFEAHAATASTPLSVQGTRPTLETSLNQTGPAPMLAEVEAALVAASPDGSR